MTLRTRFAPSPTGELHLGNARTALFAWLHARSAGGAFVLRVEDTDAERSKPECEARLLADLKWLGLDWDEGPDIGGPHAPYRQTGRLGRYREVAEALLRGGDAYWCFCGPGKLDALRKETEAKGIAYHYPGFCRAVDPEEAARRKAAGETAALRLKTPPETVVFEDLIRGRIETPAAQIADFVLVRGDGMPVYNFAVAADDHDMEITRVLRGEDHIPNTPKQILVYRALGWAIPEFAHLPMLLGPDRTKLSKRHGATSLSGLREAGCLPEAVFNALALCGWSHPEGREILSPGEIRAAFSLARVSKGAAVFDEARLKFLCGRHLRAKPAAELAALLADELRQLGLVPRRGEGAEFLDRLFAALRAQLETLADFAPAVAPLLDARPPLLEPGSPAAAEWAAALPALRALSGALAARPGALTLEDWKAACKAAMAAGGVKGRAFFHPLRLALTGRESGPELDKLIPLYEAGEACAIPAFAGGARGRLGRGLAGIGG